MPSDTKSSSGNQSGEEFPLNSCKSLNGISSLVNDAIKQGLNAEQSTKPLGINGTEISPSWKNFASISTNYINNNISNSSGENSSTSLNEIGRVRQHKMTFIIFNNLTYYIHIYNTYKLANVIILQSRNWANLQNSMYLPQVNVLGDREPPNKISKQPRGLYSSQGDLNPTQCLPRWPYESQVNTH